MKVKVSELKQQIYQALTKAGYTRSEAENIGDVFLFGQMSGKTTHGIVRLFKGDDNILKNPGDGSIEVIEKSDKSAHVLGKRNAGVLVAHVGMDKALEIASKHKVGFVTTNGTHSTSGSLSYYLEQIALAGYIGIICARSEAFVAPFNSAEPLFGTNPIGFSFPTEGSPLIFDMGTSIISFGAIISATTTGDPIPPHSALDKDGNETTDPNKALEGSVLSFDNSYKGSGLSMMVEILGGVLASAGFIDLHKEDRWGNLIMVLSPELFMSLDTFKKRMTEFQNRMESAKTTDGNKLRLPGVNTLATRDQNLADDEIEIDDEILNEFYTYL